MSTFSLQNKIVVRFEDGRVVKGHTADFLPSKPRFHVMPREGGAACEVAVADLKAIFFVRDFDGRADHVESLKFSGSPTGRAMEVVMADGEVLVGTTNGYEPHRQGFFLVPADPDSNNVRCYIVTRAVRSVTPVDCRRASRRISTVRGAVPDPNRSVLARIAPQVATVGRGR